MDSFEFLNTVKVSISTGNGKIGRVLNVSIAPIISCGNCKGCKYFCYDVKAVLLRLNVLKARARNYVFAMKYRDAYFEAIRKKLMRRRLNKYFRWHVGGEMPDYAYFCETVKIAREFPEFKFWTYTKVYGYVNRYVRENGRDAIPENYKIMFSKWDGMPIYNPYNFPVFACKLKDGNKDPMEWDAMYKCPGNCDTCKKANRGCLIGENVYADEH